MGAIQVDHRTCMVVAMSHLFQHNSSCFEHQYIVMGGTYGTCNGHESSHETLSKDGRITDVKNKFIFSFFTKNTSCDFLQKSRRHCFAPLQYTVIARSVVLPIADVLNVRPFIPINKIATILYCTKTRTYVDYSLRSD
jgi:hypothetical protein